MGGRPRTPTNILKMRGAFLNHPERAKDRENEPVCLEPIGNPPSTFTGDQLQAWKEIIGYAAEGVFVRTDTLAVERAAVLLAKIRAGHASEGEGRQFDSFLGRFGMTPADRSKVQVQKKTATNPFGELGS